MSACHLSGSRVSTHPTPYYANNKNYTNIKSQTWSQSLFIIKFDMILLALTAQQLLYTTKSTWLEFPVTCETVYISIAIIKQKEPQETNTPNKISYLPIFYLILTLDHHNPKSG